MSSRTNHHTALADRHSAEGQDNVTTTSRWLRARTAAVSTALAVGAAACGGGGTGSSGNADVTSNSGSGGAPGVEQAQQLLEENLENPTSVGIDQPLSEKPEPGKTIVSLQNPTPSTFALEEGMRQASEALGWNFETVPIETGTEGIISAFTAALQKNPDGIRVSGQPRQQYEAQLKEAERRGIAVVQDSATDEPGGGLINTTMANTAQVERFGEVIANFVVADSKGQAKIALFNIPQFPSLTAFANSFTETVESLCPNCEIENVDQQLADIGVNAPRQAVSTLQRSPDIGYLVFSLGDLSNGVKSALRSAGLGEDVKLAGSVPTAQNISDLVKGDSGAWTGFAAPVVGWRVIDVFARHFNGEPLTPVEQNPLVPTQLITSENVDSIITDPQSEDWYVGVADYKVQFKRLWQVE